MTPRRRRMTFVGLILLAVGSAAAFLLTALKSNVQYSIVPSDVFAGKAPVERAFRLGGMVETGSVKREPGSLQIQFDVTDFAHEVTVRYSGVLPDLFKNEDELRKICWSMQCPTCSPVPVCWSPMKCWPSTMKTTCRPMLLSV